MTINTFKSLCLKAGTKKADEIHNYYIKLEELLQETLKEESNEFKQKLEIKNIELKKIDENCQTNKKLERQNILLNKYDKSGPLVYIIKVKSLENEEYIIKIGESRKGIGQRFNDHKKMYNECLLLDCFSVKKSRDLEIFLHSHNKIIKNRVTDLKGHETERELFLINKHLTYQTLLNIIKDNLIKFNDIEALYEKALLEIENLKMENNLLKLNQSNNNTNSQIDYMPILQTLVNMNNELLNKIDNLNKVSNEPIIETHKTTTNLNVPLGPRVQKINSETLQIIKVYESVVQCMKEMTTVKRPSLNKAILENTVYCGFRWLFVDRENDANVIAHIEPTKVTRPQNLGYIAKLNINKSEIINVYLDKKTASTMNGYSISGLDNAVKKGTITNGFYYYLYNTCSDELRTIFENKIGCQPLLYKDGVIQSDKESNVINEFSCKYDCIKRLKMSDKTLAKVLDKNVTYNDTYFKSVGSKLVC
jgi:hypothetical protein